MIVRSKWILAEIAFLLYYIYILKRRYSRVDVEKFRLLEESKIFIRLLDNIITDNIVALPSIVFPVESPNYEKPSGFSFSTPLGILAMRAGTVTSTIIKDLIEKASGIQDKTAIWSHEELLVLAAFFINVLALYC